MSVSRRIVAIAVLAVVFPVVTAIASSGGSAFAGSPAVNATGTVSCNSITGSLKFAPGLSTGGGSSVVVKAKLNLAGCSASGSNVTSPTFSGKAKGSWSMATNRCSTIFSGVPSSTPGSLAIKWSGKAGTAKLNPTSVTLTSLTGVTAGANGNAGFTFATQETSGSFLLSMSGEIDSNENAATLGGTSGCGATKGLKKLAIDSGNDQSSDLPAITSVEPNIGPLLGNEVITIKGIGLSTADSVLFGCCDATIIGVPSDHQIEVFDPSSSETGTVDVRVHLANGNFTPIVPADQFTYVDGGGGFPNAISVSASGQSSNIGPSVCGTTGCSPLTIPQATWSGTFNFTVGVCPNAAPLSGSHPAVCYQATGSGTGTIAQYDSNGSQTCTKSITWSIGPADADGAWIESDSSGVYHLYYSLETTNYVEPSGACSGNTQIEPDGYVLWQHLHPGQGDDVGPDVFTLGQAGQSQSGQADTGDGTTSPGFSADATFTFSY